jgi:hypothetical protein
MSGQDEEDTTRVSTTRRIGGDTKKAKTERTGTQHANTRSRTIKSEGSKKGPEIRKNAKCW